MCDWKSTRSENAVSPKVIGATAIIEIFSGETLHIYSYAQL